MMTTTEPHQDETFIDRLKPSVAANILLLSIAAFVMAFGLWAAFAELDQVTRGTGRVIPSKQLQIVQNLEGGIVREIAVSQGQSVKKGDVLLRMDSTQLGADFARGQAGYNALVAKITRLQAESSFGAPSFPGALAQAAPDIVSAEMTLFSARQSELAANLSVAQSHLQQAQVQAQAAAQSARLAAQEVTMISPLVEKGIEPRIELMRAQGRAQETASQVQAANSAVNQATSEVQAVRERHRSRAVEELAAAKGQLSGMGGELPALQDRVTRTDVKAPITGTVNRVLVATVGGVVRPGEPLVEIVPKDDSLVVEAQIKPADVAFLSQGQSALVKITAFNFATYGGLEGVLEYISPDAVKDDRTGETHYLVRVRTKSSVLQTKQGPRPITAGMIAEVDVMNGKRSVLDYLLSPMRNVSNKALQE
jgi:membrane fusion protein, adhesin transport system